MDNNSSNISFLLIAGFILIVVVVCAVGWVVAVQPGGPAEGVAVSSAGTDFGFWDRFSTGRKVRLTPTPIVSAGAAAAEVGAEAPQSSAAEINLDEVIAAINKGGCTACHTIPNIPNAVGQVGPDLSNIGVDGANRREGYSAEQYIRESIMEPNAFAAPECPTGPCIAGAMPVVLLSDSELEAIVNYLSTLGVAEVSMTPE